MDVGGTMDEHIHRVEELFSAAKTEFKHLEFYYFHNCVYDFMWKNNRRRYSEKFSTWDVIRQVQQGLQADLRRRRDDEPVRDPAARRQRRIQQRGSRARSGCSGLTTPFPSSPGSTPSRKASGATGRASR
jgi:hypothetical protein